MILNNDSKYFFFMLFFSRFSCFKDLFCFLVLLKGGDRVDTKIPDPTALSDKDLKDLLLKYGVKAGPIVGEIAFNNIRCTQNIHVSANSV